MEQLTPGRKLKSGSDTTGTKHCELPSRNHALAKDEWHECRDLQAGPAAAGSCCLVMSCEGGSEEQIRGLAFQSTMVAGDRC
eukprot:585997-Hanusia_phi.AAC.2